MNKTDKIGRQTIITGDCLPIMQAMEAGSIDVIVSWRNCTAGFAMSR